MNVNLKGVRVLYDGEVRRHLTDKIVTEAEAYTILARELTLAERAQASIKEIRAAIKRAAWADSLGQADRVRIVDTAAIIAETSCACGNTLDEYGTCSVGCYDTRS